ncbi:MAG: hypothetical protein KBD78_05605 [Oligoflexales bacterium]|nr:hypothetical protein [Oligoflexales bacterium]
MNNKKILFQRKFLLGILSLVFNHALIAGQSSGFNGRIYEDSSLSTNTNAFSLSTNAMDPYITMGFASIESELEMSYIEVNHLDTAIDGSEFSNSNSVLIAGNSADLIIRAMDQASETETTATLNSEAYIDFQIVLEGELISQISLISVSESYVELSGVNDSGVVVTLFIELTKSEINN